MRIFNTCLLVICTLTTAAQQKSNIFHVIDAETNKPVPSVSVTIVRAGLSITTENDGIFTIPGDLSKFRDTVIIYTQNYSALKKPLAALSGVDTIKLKKTSSISRIDTYDFKNDTLLNDYNRLDVGNFVGLHLGNGEFKYLQIAQKFNVHRAGTLLNNVTVERLAFYFNKSKPVGDDNKNGQYEYTELEHTKFRLRIYDINPLNGGPGDELCSKVIEIKSKDDKKLATNLKDYKIFIPHQTFFVAVEWLRDYDNMGYVHINDKLGGTKGHINYRPAIGLVPTKGKTLNIWALNLNQQWSLYTYHSPDFTDLAIKATVSYQ